MERTYIAIDLKSFFASVECVDRGLDPLDANLVVADESRTEKTICLAVSPALKSYGIKGRARLFEVVERVREVNRGRLQAIPGRRFLGSSTSQSALLKDPALQVSYVTAMPRMSRYMQVSSQVFSTYLRHVAPEDIHAYSIDEVFIDATDYLKLYHLPAQELAQRLILDVLKETGVTATAGIGSNLYLAKVAMDIEAKHQMADENGVRIASLNEHSFRERLWSHTPLTDFWRLGPGIQSKLSLMGIQTMGDLARCSLDRRWQNQLFSVFGIQAELLIDHAWGCEPCTIKYIKAYRPKDHSLQRGQVLQSGYTKDKALLIIREMADEMALELVAKQLLCSELQIDIGYDALEKGTEAKAQIKAPVEKDRYGRLTPKMSHGTIQLGRHTSSSSLIMEAASRLFLSIVRDGIPVRRLYLGALHVLSRDKAPERQMDLFEQDAAVNDQKEFQRQQAILSIREKYGSGALLRGMNFEEGSTLRERQGTVGGHKA